ncbi:MAG: outer membrane beta-barrel protein [Coraliomargarita sp.]|nr:outer membrane beta-barrel protein [Coraliomargarita sp.]
MKQIITASLLSFGLAATAQAEWKFGIGAGVGVFDIDGDLSEGGVSGDFEYDTGDIESAFGLNGYAANGPWTIKAFGSYLEVEADQDAGNVTIPDLTFERTTFESTVGYTYASDSDWKLGVFGGLKYVDIDISAGGAGGDDDFIDVVIGATASYMFAEKWSWDSMVDASFGDSEGTYGVTSGVTWRFAKNWSTSAMLAWETYEYDVEDSTLDADEIVLGLGIMYHF